MAIQGTQVPMYTKYTLFFYFSNFLYKKKKKNWKQINKNMLNKTYHKTRPTQKQESKTHK